MKEGGKGTIKKFNFSVLHVYGIPGHIRPTCQDFDKMQPSGGVGEGDTEGEGRESEERGLRS